MEVYLYLSVCMSVTHLITSSELLIARGPVRTWISKISLVGVPGKSSQVKTLPAKSVVADSNPGWTLHIGRVLCVSECGIFTADG